MTKVKRKIINLNIVQRDEKNLKNPCFIRLGAGLILCLLILELYDYRQIPSKDIGLRS